MAVIAANVTEKSVNILARILSLPEFVRFKADTNLDLSDNTVLLRLAMIHFIQNIPSVLDVDVYKAALLRPQSFEDFLRSQIQDKR